MTRTSSNNQRWSFQRFGYVPALDGVRACAVLGVLGLHGGAHINGGFIGVDIFFVLSGFLISALLLQEWAGRGRLRLVAFYVRRARRLLPALALTLVGVSLLVAIFHWYYKGTVDFGIAALSVVFYSGNWVDAFVNGHHHGALGPLTHTWSLAIEEQFYLLWPAVLLVCLRRRVGPRSLLTVLVSLAALSAIERGLLWKFHAGGDPYYRSDTHADGILLGCSLAVARSWAPTAEVLQRFLRSTALAATAAGILLGVGLGVTLTSAFMFLGGFFLVALAAAVLVGHAVSAEESMVSRLLALRFLRWIGERSYGIYLFHIPIIELLSKQRMGIPTPAAFAIQVALTFGIAAASYRYVELRFLRKKRATEPADSLPSESSLGSRLPAEPGHSGPPPRRSRGPEDTPTADSTNSALVDLREDTATETRATQSAEASDEAL